VDRLVLRSSNLEIHFNFYLLTSFSLDKLFLHKPLVVPRRIEIGKAFGFLVVNNGYQFGNGLAGKIQVDMMRLEPKL